MKMNQFKRELLAKEFPFLGNIGLLKCRKCGGTHTTEEKTDGYNSPIGHCQVCGEFHGGFDVVEQRSKHYFLNADDVSIKRVDSNLLDFTPWLNEYDWSGGNQCNYEKAYAIDYSGNGIIIESLDYSIDSKTGSGKSYESSSESIGCQLRAKGISPMYILIDKYEDTDSNGNGDTCRSITIYKNKGDSQFHWEKSQLKKAYMEINAELSVVA